MLEALESFLHFDGSFFRTTLTLLFKPGRLTARFHAGKRASQVPPFRLYVFVAFVFFLLMHSMDFDQVQVEATGAVAPPARESAGPMPSAAESAAGGGEPLAEVYVEDAPEWLEEIAKRLAQPEERHQISQRFLSSLPKVMLVCVPVFALLTRLLWRRAAGWVYLKHLVLALHFHAFVYAWTLLVAGTTWLASLPGWGLDQAVHWAGNLWMLCYAPLMLRHLFGDTWSLTLLKSVLLVVGYAAVLMSAFAAAAIAVVAV